MDNGGSSYGRRNAIWAYLAKRSPYSNEERRGYTSAFTLAVHRYAILGFDYLFEVVISVMYSDGNVTKNLTNDGIFRAVNACL